MLAIARVVTPSHPTGPLSPVWGVVWHDHLIQSGEANKLKDLKGNNQGNQTAFCRVDWIPKLIPKKIV